jgi:hypothetical protein
VSQLVSLGTPALELVELLDDPQPLISQTTDETTQAPFTLRRTAIQNTQRCV